MGKVWEKGCYFEKGKITAVGDVVKIPQEAEVLIYKKTVLPGFIDAHTHLGVLENISEEGDDLNEYTEPVTPG